MGNGEGVIVQTLKNTGFKMSESIKKKYKQKIKGNA